MNVIGKLQYRSYRNEGEASDRQVAGMGLDLRGELDVPAPKPEAGAA